MVRRMVSSVVWGICPKWQRRDVFVRQHGVQSSSHLTNYGNSGRVA